MTDHELPVYARIDLDVVEAHGTRVLTADGRELLDLYGGHAVALLGHGHPRLLAALHEQADRLFFQTNIVDLEVRRRAAALLVDFAPPDLTGVFFVNTGSEANENALRLAIRMTGRKKVVALSGAFHGRGAAAAACTDGAAGRWYGFPATPFEVERVPPDDLEALDWAIDDKTAAFIVEAVQGVAGARDLDLEYLRAASAKCTERGAWLIADEVQCGLGRTGERFGISAAGVTPDAITLAKGLAGGYPAGAVLVGQETAGRLATGDLGTTFGGGPLACALIAATLELLAEPGLLPHVAAIGQRIRETCLTGPVRSIQGRGLLVGLVTEPPASQVLPALRERGILAGGAKDPHVVRLMPPLTLQESEVDELASALSDL